MVRRLRNGEAIGFAGTLQLADGSFHNYISHSAADHDGMDVVNALGDLMHNLG